MDEFRDALDRCLRQIPRGRVATCGGIARALGDVRAARAVASWLTEYPATRTGHRVVRADGRPVLPTASQRLVSERIPLRGDRVPANRFVPVRTPEGLLDRLRREQRDLSRAVTEKDEGGPARRIAGVDVAYDDGRMYAAAVCVDASTLAVTEVATVARAVSFPYIPTYLARREFPGIEAATRRLSARPDVLMVDGHGRLHPALFGVACDAGVRLDIPTIGVAKHPLVGHAMKALGGDAAAIPVALGGVTRGYAWVPPGRGRPIFVSVGHRISLATSLDLVRRTTRHRYPEPLVLADRASKEMKRNEKREKGARR
ncbi:MAG TPA: endonuclease V [Thermoplasmata archaeon]